MRPTRYRGDARAAAEELTEDRRRDERTWATEDPVEPLHNQPQAGPTSASLVMGLNK